MLVYEDDIHDLFEYALVGRSVPIRIGQTHAQYDVLRGILEPVFRLMTSVSTYDQCFDLRPRSSVLQQFGLLLLPPSHTPHTRTSTSVV